jgi:glycosyltransferase involved in cell wall biosynthesis
MISFIVPAHNEQMCLGRTLQAIHEAARSVNQPYEVIVVDDASTDTTAEIARQNNARVVSVNHRQIAATRNSGGRAAQGEQLFFVDADTIINPHIVASALRHMDKGAAGGGAPSRFDGLCRFTRGSCCGGSIGLRSWREFPVAHSCFARVKLFTRSAVLTNDFLVRRMQ